MVHCTFTQLTSWLVHCALGWHQSAALALIVLRVGIGGTDGWSWLTAWLGLSWFALLCSVGEMLLCSAPAVLCPAPALLCSATCYLCSGGDWWRQKISKVTSAHHRETPVVGHIFNNIVQASKQAKDLIFLTLPNIIELRFCTKYFENQFASCVGPYVSAADIFQGRYNQEYFHCYILSRTF